MIYRPKSEGEDVAQIFIEVLKENIKNIHKEFDFANLHLLIFLAVEH